MTPIWVIVLFFVGMVIVYGINTWDTGYAVNKYGSGNVYGGNNWASCKRVINNCDIGTGIFVPTKYDPEWDGANGFLAKKPDCVTIAPCICTTNSECRGGDVCGNIPKSISAWSNHTCSLLYNGMVYCWWDNQYWQLWNGSNSTPSTPVQVSGITNAVEIDAWWDHTCAILSDGKIKCRWRNTDGQLWIWDTTNRNVPVQLSYSFSNTIVRLSAWWNHTCAGANNGSTYCWWDNQYWQLWDATTEDKYFPVLVNWNNQFESISAWLSHTCGITFASKVMCWWNGANLRLWNERQGISATPSDVFLNAYGYYGTPNSISAGNMHTCVMRDNSSVQCWWAYGWYGPTSAPNTYYDGSTRWYPALLWVNQHVWSDWSAYNRDWPILYLSPNLHTISAWWDHTCVTSDTDYNYCWWKNDHGQLWTTTTSSQYSTAIDPSSLPGWNILQYPNGSDVQIAVWSQHTCAIGYSGIFCVWSNEYGQVAPWADSTDKLLGYQVILPIPPGTIGTCITP